MVGKDHMKKMFLKIFPILLLLILSISIPSTASDRDLFFSGYVRTYNGALLKESGEYTLIRNTFNLNIEQRKGNVSFKVNPYIYQYSGKDLDIGLRQAYMDIFFRTIDLRVGKQQIIWGKAEGVFITDIISPKDMTEFLLPDFEEIRMGVNAVKADYYLGNHTFELVWLPVFTPTLMPSDSSIWQPQMNFAIPPQFDYSQKKVKKSLENSEVFFKYSAITSAADFELMAGYAWDDDPTMHVEKTIDPETHELTNLTVIPKHHRLTITGGSFSTTLGPLVLRSEGAYYAGKYFNTADSEASQGVVKKNYLHYLLGLDYTIWDINMSAQFIQQTILDYDESIDSDQYENTITYLMRKDFLRETLTLELFSYFGINNDDALLRPKIYYDIYDGFELTTGVNLFTGNKGRFGQYDNNDMVYMKLKYSF
ncbi:MAG: hypothetical protein KGY75_08190 [Candidatus Cloacimonetes bacterium]|nr:hypothetical protein [Candidatus Cloacimonadota bacterium]MBS3768081.1 hypothetical protein [Candidatus Cloacimonadota bacterium]